MTTELKALHSIVILTSNSLRKRHYTKCDKIKRRLACREKSFKLKQNVFNLISDLAQWTAYYPTTAYKILFVLLLTVSSIVLFILWFLTTYKKHRLMLNFCLLWSNIVACVSVTVWVIVAHLHNITHCCLLVNIMDSSKLDHFCFWTPKYCCHWSDAPMSELWTYWPPSRPVII